MFCENCGIQLAEATRFCPSCGTKIEAPPVDTAAVQSPAPPPPPPGYEASVQTPPPPPPACKPAVQAASPPPQSYVPQPAYGIQAQPGSEPLRVGQYIGMFLLMCIPILNIILLFVWSFGSSANLNKKNFARASLILSAIMLIFWLIAGGLIMGALESIVGGYY